ncbi:Uncharacterized protein TCM_019815 [Theobroma cacao]|uniref:Proton pump interactor 1 n=1 Tax=Theobroma cacao TaxID=3641 RepID=A0A061EHW0_THECC|nr:Uncharacterized protein TCM_019815 [Theobroma cacao]
MTATDCLEANSMQQIPILKGEGDVNTSAIENLNFELNKPPKRIVLDEVGASKKAKGKNVCSQLDHLYNRSSSISCGLEWQKIMLDYLQEALDKLNFSRIAQNGGASKSIFSTGRNTDIRWNCYGSEDKVRHNQMLEKIKQIEERKEKALADSAMKGEIWNPLTVRNAIQEQIKLVNKISLELRRKKRDGCLQFSDYKEIVRLLTKRHLFQKIMATDCLEANSMQQIPVFKGEADVISSAIEKLDLQLNKPKKGFKRRMLHGSSNMATERQILKEIARSQQRLNDFIDPRPLLQEYIWWYSYGNIDKARYIQMVENMKQIEEREEKALGDAIAKGEPWNPLSAKRAIQEQIKLVNKISMELRRERSEVMPEIVRIEKDLKAMEKEARLLIQQQRGLRQRKVEAQERILNLRQQMNDRYHEYLSLLSDARELARKKDVGALRKLSQGQVKKFMSKWKTSKTFRISYEISISPSLDNRQLSRDGRTHDKFIKQGSKSGNKNKGKRYHPYRIQKPAWPLTLAPMPQKQKLRLLLQTKTRAAVPVTVHEAESKPPPKHPAT